MNQTIILFDTEYTAWEGSQKRRWSGPGEHREIIQIAALRVDLNGKVSEVGSFNRLVLPARNPKLSDYIVQLTGITQPVLEAGGVPFQSAFSDFFTFCGQGRYPLFSWGDDPGVLRENCDLSGTVFPAFHCGFHDIRDVLERGEIDTRHYSSGTVWQALGLGLELAAHDALNDVRSLLATIQALDELGRLAIDPA